MADPTPRDVPAGNIARLREEVRRLMGLQGSVLDTAITMRRAQDLGILDANGHFIRVGGPPGGSGSPGPPGPPAPGITPDLTPPPTVTNLTAVAGLSQVIAMWDAALYTQGHGHLQTNIYAATRNPGDPQATFSDATLRYSATGALTIASLPSEPNIRWHIWAKWKTVDGVESINPAGGANGVVVTTGQDVSHLLAVLTNQITTSQLYSALNTRIDLIDAPSGTAGSVNARIATETTARSAADTALSNTITTLSATVSNNYTTLNSAITTEASTRASADTTNATNITTLSSRVDGVQAAASFEPYVLWDFTNTLDGWTGSGGLFTPAAEWAQFVSTSTDPVLFSPAVSFPGLRYDKVRARVKRTAGSAWQGTCFYGNAGHGMSASFNKSIPDTTQLNQWVVLEWDMTLLDVGGTDWVDGVTNQIRLDFGTSSADTFLVDWVAIGRRSTGVASTVVAAIQATQSTQATQISSNATSITTVQSNLTAGDAALSAQVSTEATTRANVDGYLGAQYTVRVATTQGGRTVQGGFGISSTSAPGAGGTITMGVLANQFYVAAPSGSAPGVTDVLPFVVQTTDQVVNGVTVPKGVYMDAAYINNLTAMYARFGTLVADSIAAGSINAAHLTLGDGTIGGNLKSSNYIGGTSGWLLQPNGTAEFGAAAIRGQLVASQIDTRNLTIKDAGGTVIFGSGTLLGTSYAASGLVNSNVSISAGGALSGGGGGTVTLGGMGAGAFATLNQINSGNVSTYIANAAIGAAHIGSLDASVINAGAIRGINVNSGSHTTVGSFLTSSCAAAATTLNVQNTVDFPASGSGYILGATNPDDAFTWTGKTATTLTGCSGVLAHGSGDTVVPLAKGIVIDANQNEMRFFGDAGGGIEPLASIGVTGVTVANCAVFGSRTPGNVRRGAAVVSYGGHALYLESLQGASMEAYANATFGHLLLHALPGRPSDRRPGQIAMIYTAGGTTDNRTSSPQLMVTADGTNWHYFTATAVFNG